MSYEGLSMGPVKIATFDVSYTSPETYDISIKPGGKGEGSAEIGAYADSQGNQGVVICVDGGALLSPGPICGDGLSP